MEHNLKISHAMFEAVALGLKNAEFRKNDRDFQVGETLVLHDTDPPTNVSEQAIFAIITHIVYGPEFHIPEGYAMLSFGEREHRVVLHKPIEHITVNTRLVRTCSICGEDYYPPDTRCGCPSSPFVVL